MAGPFPFDGRYPDFAKVGFASVEIAPPSVPSPLMEIYAWQADEVERLRLGGATRALMGALRSARSFPLDPLSGRLHIRPTGKVEFIHAKCAQGRDPNSRRPQRRELR